MTEEGGNDGRGMRNFSRTVQIVGIIVRRFTSAKYLKTSETLKRGFVSLFAGHDTSAHESLVSHERADAPGLSFPRAPAHRLRGNDVVGGGMTVGGGLEDTMPGIHLEKTGGVASVVIDGPPLNVLNLALLRELRQVLDALDRDDAVELVEISGAGERAFSAGVDVKDHTRTQVPEMLDLVHGVIRKLMSLRQPTIAVVDGVCLGGGCELASSCDLVLASEESSFATPEITVGCFPPVALARFSSQIGYHRAAEMILTGRRLSAHEAASVGLVNRVVPRHQLAEALEALRGELLDKSRAVLRITLKGLREIGLKQLSAALARSEEIYLKELLETEDVEEGVQAFVEKRKPQWQHR